MATCVTFDLVSQSAFDIFSHKQYLNTNEVEISLCDGMYKIEPCCAAKNPFVQINLNTIVGANHLIEVEGWKEHKNNCCPCDGKCVVEISINSGCTQECIYIDATDDENRTRSAHFKAKSPKSCVTISLKNCRRLWLCELQIIKVCVDLESTTVVSSCYTDTNCEAYKLEPFPRCPQHGYDCPHADNEEYGDPNCCPVHGYSCPTFR